MKPMVEIANMLTNFVSQTAKWLTSLLALIVIPPIRSRSRKVALSSSRALVSLTFASTTRIPAFLVGLSLSGCTGSTYSSHFDCPMGEGAGCASISRVNKMIDRQEIDLTEGRPPVEGRPPIEGRPPVEDRLPSNDDMSSSRGPVRDQGEGNPHSLGNQVYVYYGPDQLSRLIPADGLETSIATLERGATFDRESTFDRGPTFGRGSTLGRESTFDRESTLDQEGN